MDTNNQIVVYQTADNQTQIEVHMENETVWLTQAQMAELFQKDRTVISRHIRNVFNEGELEEQSTCAKLHTWVMMVYNNMRQSITKCKLNKKHKKYLHNSK